MTVGHVVASIADRTSEEGRQRKTTSNTSPLASQTDSDTDKHRQTQQSTSVTDHAAPQEEMQARVPSISFPPRRTPQGEVVSLLPAGQAAEYTHSVANSSPLPPPPAAATAQTSPIRSAPEPPRLYIRVPPRDGAAVTRPSALRKELSDREIEAIMLGGIND